MIIQSGYDLDLLARPYIVQDGTLRPRLVLISVDEEMRLDDVRVVSDDFHGTLKPFHDAILSALDPAYSKFFAIAHPGRFSEFAYSEPITDEAQLLEEAAATLGFRLIGHFALDETGSTSAGARSFFDQYPSHDDLPRTMFHWAHSKLGKCG